MSAPGEAFAEPRPEGRGGARLSGGRHIGSGMNRWDKEAEA
jgi:hypothetical protein